MPYSIGTSPEILSPFTTIAYLVAIAVVSTTKLCNFVKSVTSSPLEQPLPLATLNTH